MFGPDAVKLISTSPRPSTAIEALKSAILGSPSREPERSPWMTSCGEAGLLTSSLNQWISGAEAPVGNVSLTP